MAAGGGFWGTAYAMICNLYLAQEVYPDGGTELTRFELPESLIGWSFASYQNGQKLAVSPGGDRVLAALGFDVGGGIRSMDCDTLTSDPSRLENADCLLVIRLSLQAEALPPSDSGAL